MVITATHVCNVTFFLSLQATKLASATAQKTKELGASVNDSVIKPTSEKVSDRNSVSRSCFVCVFYTKSLEAVHSILIHILREYIE